MGGLANFGISCSTCGSPHAAKRDGLCRDCRCRGLGQARRKYFFTPDLLDTLQLAQAGKKPEITARLDALCGKTGWPRHAFQAEAARRGWTRSGSRPWQPEELEYLLEKLGTFCVKRIARKLRRSAESVESKAEKLHLSRRLREGYNLADLGECFGEHHFKIRRWADRGLLGKVHAHGGEQRVAERNVVRFINRHASEYDLRRVDQVWFKAMVFGSPARYQNK